MTLKLLLDSIATTTEDIASKKEAISLCVRVAEHLKCPSIVQSLVFTLEFEQVKALLP